ncbi:MAG: hypothetical protein M3044_01950 [Thermoproteota archaeon]|nr:hypothetical protein [Thermoproteota archaeon]
MSKTAINRQQEGPVIANIDGTIKRISELKYVVQEIRSIFHLSGRLELDQLNSMCWQIFTHGLNVILVFHIPYVTTTASTIGANTSTLNTNTTSPSSSSSKR